MVVRNCECRQGAAATQRGAVPGAARRRIGIEREQRHRRRGAPENWRAAALHEEVGIIAQGLCAGRVDQQRRD